MRKVVNLNQTPSAVNIVTQFFISISIIFGFALLFSVIGVFVAALATGQDMAALTSTDPANVSDTTIQGLKIIQVFSVIGIFVLPALLLPKMLFKVNPLKYTGLSGHAPILLFVLALLSYYALVPLLDLSIRFNQAMDLPGFLQGMEDWMRNAEDTNALITQQFLKMPTFTHFLVNVFIIALLPALSEELFFRGFIQRTFYSWWRNKHAAVIVTAIIFSAIHVQFYGFLPRMLLGMLLGYLFVWSGDLKLPIFIHFLNNFTSLVVAYYNQDNLKDFDVTSAADYPVYLYFLSAVLGGFLLYQLYRFSRKRHLSADLEAENNAYLQLDGDSTNWAKVFSTHSIYAAEIVAGNLESEGIKAVVVNKQDSSYGFGEAEVFVHAEDAERARQSIPSYKI